MAVKPPRKIEDMQVLYYCPTKDFEAHLKKYMPDVPAIFIIVQEEDGTYCLLGTDDQFENWDSYTNYVFRDLTPAMDLPHVIFRLPPVQWIKA